MYSVSRMYAYENISDCIKILYYVPDFTNKFRIRIIFRHSYYKYRYPPYNTVINLEKVRNYIIRNKKLVQKIKGRRSYS